MEQVNIYFETRPNTKYFLSCEDFLSKQATFKNFNQFAEDDIMETIFKVVPNFSFKAQRALSQLIARSSQEEDQAQKQEKMQMLFKKFDREV